MELGLDIPAYWPDWDHAIENLYPEMIAAAQFAEGVGFTSFALAEHHFIDYFAMPAPLALASHMAAVTQSARFLLSVLCLPHHDVRRLAGEITVADHLTKGRLDVGFGRGSNRYEPNRFGLEFDDLPSIFEEQVEAMVLLLNEQDIAFEGQYVKFPSLTIMPPPYQKPHPPLWIAAVTAASAYKAAKRGFSVQTASLRRPFPVVQEIVQSFRAGVAESTTTSRQKISMGTWVYVAENQADIDEKLLMAHANHRRFMNLVSTPGIVSAGRVEAIEIDESVQALGETLIIGSAQYCVDKLSEYEALGLDQLMIRKHFGPAHGDVLGSLERFSEAVMPHLARSAEDASGSSPEVLPAAHND